MHRWTTRAMASIRENLRRHLAFQQRQSPHSPRPGTSESDRSGYQAFERPQPGCPLHLAQRCSIKVTILFGDAGKNRARQNGVFSASDDFVEMRNPGKKTCAYDIRARCHQQTSKTRLLTQPMLNQLPHFLAGGGTCRDEIGYPIKTVPGRVPIFGPSGRKPARCRVAHQNPGKFDLARGDRQAALWIARPDPVNNQLCAHRSTPDEAFAGKHQPAQEIMPQLG